ncbi:hypothetical protein HYH03_001252 [Edaphochlamys debaryana]|uniref:Uncharacterized protein n=1 Tax=Edaphochlamys debaryana TaxID=47281 RepID=A0A835YHU0_9CHLO|nr:hypothetical protein HYH03_001252 [Edaphochlamys debaryana]|eukprot:KAG2501473.1 hypothetical protein HYH03_001252 [Edaphochlamys debaryana]
MGTSSQRRRRGGLAACAPVLIALVVAGAYVASAGLPAGMPEKSKSAPRDCEQFAFWEASTNLLELAASVSITLPDLQALNPHVTFSDVPEPGVATPLCVIGGLPSPNAAAADPGSGAKPAQVGRRPKTLTAYSTTPGAGSCLDLISRAQPPMDFGTFLALNPKVNCRALGEAPTTVYLPKGTIIEASRSTNPRVADDVNCLVGPWGRWTDCSVDGTQARYRSTYRDASGAGKACPPTFETRECSDGAALPAAGPTRRSALASYQCPSGYNGCSVPAGLPYYHLFVPACNLHDICYSCDRHATWEFASRSYCDSMFYDKMSSQCSSYWTGYWDFLDLGYCYTMASSYWTAVSLFGAPNYAEENTPNGLWWDGCYWWPWEWQVNNVNGGGFHPGWAGCPCYGTSCQYW